MSSPLVVTTHAEVTPLPDDVELFTYQAACQCVRSIVGGKAGLLRYWLQAAERGKDHPFAIHLYSAGAEWHIRIRYTSPQGWTVETPELTLPLEQGAEVRWEKPLKP